MFPNTDEGSVSVRDQSSRLTKQQTTKKTDSPRKKEAQEDKLKTSFSWIYGYTAQSLICLHFLVELSSILHDLGNKY